MIRIRDLGKSWGDNVAVSGLDLDIARGETLVLLGSSGSGKTTTLKMINRLIEPTTGHVEIDGRNTLDSPAWEIRRAIGYAFQEVGLFPHLTVAENIALPLRLRGDRGDRQRQRVDGLLERVELAPDEFRERLPAELSGGQAQRVGLARSLSAEPPLLLLDEPFGALDPLVRSRLQKFFVRLRSELELTVIFVTHDMAEALILADRIAVLDQGRILQLGTPRELLRNPAGELVRSLMESPLHQAGVVENLLSDPLPTRPDADG